MSSTMTIAAIHRASSNLEALEARKVNTLRVMGNREEVPFYILPDTLRNWPYAERVISPYYRAAQAESVAWLENFHPFTPAGQKAFNKCDFSLICALTYHKASHEILRSCCDFMHAFFMLDEHTDPLPTDQVIIHCEVTMDAILHPDKPRPEGEPIIGEIARQFWKRASTYAHQATKERFLKAWRSYLDSIILQAQRRDKDRYICTIDEYIAARRDNCGAYPCFAFLEISLGLNIPHYVTEHPYLVALNRDTNDMIVLANDMCSYKEILVDDADYNAVTAAFSGFLTPTMRSLDVLNKRGFPSFGEDLDRQIADYIERLGQWIRGQDEWNFCSGRYSGEDGLKI
ncbi:isoprenoid synthase domain-containing protein [Gymnopilus junonius]|uniref:Terpene synthase n=1 Tax=Gymnopilus junonius TaxID=109634 RepID=A0A9P5NT18_GYMJU|nr:isoprenoid synthase domain-containing protein [Gymnopilus junonius]